MSWFASCAAAPASRKALRDARFTALVVTARVTAYELFLEPLEVTAFPVIQAEADQRGLDVRRRDQFVLLGQVGATLREVVPEDSPPDALDEYSELLYQSFQFWTFGHRMYDFGEEITERLTSPSFDVGKWMLAGPPSCYLQFPYQRLWARVAADAAFEPVDGCFVVVDDTQPAPDAGAHLRIQMLLGVRDDRPGVSLVSYRTDLHPRQAAEHATPSRDDGEAFENVIPGGERKGYKTIVTVSELEALVVRALCYLDRNSQALVAEPGSAAEGETHLPYTAVRA